MLLLDPVSASALNKCSSLFIWRLTTNSDAGYNAFAGLADLILLT
jgi:hypothetical protein